MVTGAHESTNGHFLGPEVQAWIVQGRRPLTILQIAQVKCNHHRPHDGDRATEIAAVLVRDGQIVDQYQSLMNAERAIPGFITGLTGITSAMVRKAPPASQVIAEVADFVGDHPLIAHKLVTRPGGM